MAKEKLSYELKNIKPTLISGLIPNEKIYAFSFLELIHRFVEKNPVENSLAQPKEYVMGFVRDSQDKIKAVHSKTPSFDSDRQIFTNPDDPMIFFGGSWESKRIMKEVPLYISAETVHKFDKTADYDSLPDHLRDILDKVILRTSGVVKTKFSLLMSTAKNDPSEGRTGVLLYNGQPVIVNVNGKEFLVEIKGAGCSDGNNVRTTKMRRTDYFELNEGETRGGLDPQDGKREFKNLETQRKVNNKTFISGDAVRAVGLANYTDDLNEKQAYLVRLSPGSIRSSFSTDLSAKSAKREMTLTTSIAEHYVELALLDTPMLHSTIHPENFLRSGNRYVLTDFADCRAIDQIPDPFDFLSQVLEKIKETPGITEKGINNFYSKIAKGLGVQWDPKTGYKGFIEAIWAGYFAIKVYNLRKGRDEEVRADIAVLEKCAPLYEASTRTERLIRLFLINANTYLLRQIKLLEHIDAPEAKESLKIARKNLAQINAIEINETELLNAGMERVYSLYKLLYLPYMDAKYAN